MEKEGEKMKLEIGKKYKLGYYKKYIWEQVLYIGKDRFFAIDQDGEESSHTINKNWLPYEEPLPTYCYWYSGLDLEERAVLTEKELLRRYIDHLAEIVNEGWKPDWSDGNQEKCYIYGCKKHLKLRINIVSSSIMDVTYFKSWKLAERVRDVASEQLKELFGVDK